MNDSLQTVKSAVNTNMQNKTISFFELFTQGTVGTIISIILFIFLIITIYIFLERYLILNKVINRKPHLLKDVGDLIHQTKLEAAMDLCRKSGTPEGRVLYKGLSRIGKTTKEISYAMESSAQLEIFELEKKTGLLGVISGAAPMLGFLGTVIGISIAFLSSGLNSMSSAQIMTEGIYTSLISAGLGLFVGLIAFLAYNILVIKTKKVLYSLQLTITDFLDLMNKPIV